PSPAELRQILAQLLEETRDLRGRERFEAAPDPFQIVTQPAGPPAVIVEGVLQATGVLGRCAHASDLGPQVGLHGVEIAGDRRGAGVVTAVTILSRPGGSR